MVGNKGYKRKFELQNFYGNAWQAILIGYFVASFYLPLQAADTSAVNALELARSYRDNRQFSEAEQQYTNITSNYPQTDYALTAYKELAIMQVDLEAAPAAETTRQGLMQAFANHPDISEAVNHIGDAWRQKGYHTEAISIYNDVTSRWPNEGHAMWSAMGRAICYAHLEEDVAAQAEVDAMITTFAEQQGLAQAISSVGDGYRKLEKWEKSRSQYRYVVENHPKEQTALWSGMGLAIASVRLNDLETAAQSTASLLADFPEDVRLSNAACQIADEYRRIQKYDAACPLYQYVVDHFPEAEFALWSRMGLAIANVRTRNLDTAVYFAARSAEKLLADFPEDPRMNYAVGQIADAYRQAKQYEAACPLYQYVVDNFPESGYALWSRMGLAIANIRMKNLEAAAGSVT